MQSTNAPTKMPVPFADSGTKNVIPVPSQIGVTPGAASFTTGFPPLTFTPIAAGGVPPFGADFNGVLNAITQALRWNNAGGQYVYDAAFAASVGGYPKGALLQRSTLDGFWINTTDNNSTNPDTGGAGWSDPLSGRLINVQTFTSSGTYTPTPGTKSIVVEGVGGGASGGGAAATSAGQYIAGGGGGSGSYAKGRFTSGFAGLSVTIGAGGAASSAGGSGVVGGTTSLGSIMVMPGGASGVAGTTVSSGAQSGYGGSPTGGNIVQFPGQSGYNSTVLAGTTLCYAGQGGSTPLGNGAWAPSNMGPRPGNGYGSGSAGCVALPSSSAQSSAAGQPGIIIIYEYA